MYYVRPRPNPIGIIEVLVLLLFTYFSVMFSYISIANFYFFSKYLSKDQICFKYVP